MSQSVQQSVFYTVSDQYAPISAKVAETSTEKQTTQAQVPAQYIKLQSELIEKKSRFIARLAYVNSEAEVDDFLVQVKKEFPSASHYVCVWILNANRFHFADYGEPAKTAGYPIYQALCAENLQRVCCIVVRYFGGTLLGTGGLIRAYGGVTRQLLENIKTAGLLLEQRPKKHVILTVPYHMFDKISWLMRQLNGETVKVCYEEAVSLRLSFEPDKAAEFLAQLDAVGLYGVAEIISPDAPDDA